MTDTEDYLSLFYYDATSPTHLRWAVDRYSGRGRCKLEKRKGDAAGDLKQDGYGRVPYNGKRILAHRLVWELFNGPIPDGTEIDHIDGDRANNAPLNLRAVSRTLNTRNQKQRSTNTSGKTGVCRLEMNDGKYQYYTAYWREGGKRYSRQFSINSLGEEEALSSAKEFRQSQIDRMNAVGAGYTDRHNQQGE